MVVLILCILDFGQILATSNLQLPFLSLKIVGADSWDLLTLCLFYRAAYVPYTSEHNASRYLISLKVRSEN